MFSVKKCTLQEYKREKRVSLSFGHRPTGEEIKNTPFDGGWIVVAFLLNKRALKRRIEYLFIHFRTCSAFGCQFLAQLYYGIVSTWIFSALCSTTLHASTQHESGFHYWIDCMRSSTRHDMSSRLLLQQWSYNEDSFLFLHRGDDSHCNLRFPFQCRSIGGCYCLQKMHLHGIMRNIWSLRSIEYDHHNLTHTCCQYFMKLAIIEPSRLKDKFNLFLGAPRFLFIGIVLLCLNRNCAVKENIWHDLLIFPLIAEWHLKWRKTP